MVGSLRRGGGKPPEPLKTPIISHVSLTYMYLILRESCQHYQSIFFLYPKNLKNFIHKYTGFIPNIRVFFPIIKHSIVHIFIFFIKACYLTMVNIKGEDRCVDVNSTHHWTLPPRSTQVFIRGIS